MRPLGRAWGVPRPYRVGLAVASSRPVSRLVASHVGVATARGWTPLITLVVSVIGLGDSAGATALFAAPFVGFAFWVPRRDDDGDGDGPPPEDPPLQPPARVLQQPRHRRRGSAGSHSPARTRRPASRP